MIPQVLLSLVILACLTVVFGRFIVAANPATLARALRLAVPALLVIAGAFALLRGFVQIAIILFAIAGFLGRMGASGWPRSGAPKSPNQSSQVASDWFSMSLDHDTGAMDGEVLQGDFAGRSLSELGLEDLLVIYRACLASPDQSARLLEAYLDRHHEHWREQAGSETGSAGPGEGGPMSLDEAYAILGLEPGADIADVRIAHRRMMRQFHPDVGGSDYLAGKINQAKDFLIEALEPQNGSR